MMPWMIRTLARFAAIFNTRRMDRELEEDVATHLELLTDEYVAKGMTPEAARRAARLRFGSVASATELHRDVRSLRWVETVALDLRYAVRMIRRQKILSCAVVLTLSVGIATPTSVFSLLNSFIFRTPISRDPDAFFRVVRPDGGARGVATVPQYLAFQSESTSARELAAWSTTALRAPMGLEDPSSVPGLFVTCNFFHVFGVDKPVAGRLLGPDDCKSAVPVAIISEALWRSRFGGDPSFVGHSLRYGPASVTVVGVAAAPAIQRQACNPGGDFVADLWVPYTAQPALQGTSDLLDLMLRPNRDRSPNTFPWLELAGLLQPGTSRQTAAAEFHVIEARHDPFDSLRQGAVAVTDGSRWASTPLEMLGFFAMALVLPALVFVMACVNVSGLLLARAVGRQREMAVRLALGTSKGALIRMLLIESLTLAGLAAFVSLFLVYALPPILVRFFDAELMFGAANALMPDWRAFACLGFCGVLAAVLSGLAPALETLNPRLAESLKGRVGFISRSRTSRTRRVFVGIQIAACIVPLVVAVTFARTASRFMDPGFSTAHVLVAEIRSVQPHDVPLSSVAGSLVSSAGVATVAYTDTLPLLTESSMRIRIPDQSGDAFPLAASVSMDYFDVFDIPILAGRSFAKEDMGPAAGIKPVVVSRQLARRFFGKDNALGQFIETGGAAGGARMVIVGVSGDRVTGLSRTKPALNDGSMIYQLIDPSAASGFLLVKAKGDAGAMADELRVVLRTLTGTATSVQTFQSKLADNVVGVRRVQSLLLAMGIVSLVLAIIGVVGAVSADTNQRRKEFAIRVALGAGPWTVRRGVVRAGLLPVPVAVLLGLLASWGALKVAESQRFLPLGSVAGDPTPYVAIAVFLLVVFLSTLLAVAYPVGGRDPLRLLREE